MELLGVGYSYSSDGNTTTNDDLTSLENYEGLKKFFELHPSFRNHSTFIMGESYGGVYVPSWVLFINFYTKNATIW